MYGMLSGQQPTGLPLFQQGLLQLNSSSTHHQQQQGSCLWTAAAAATKWETSALSSQQQQQQQQHQLRQQQQQQQQQQDQVATSVLAEPTSVLDLRSPSSPNNSRALSSSCSSDAAPTALSHSSASHARLAAVSSASSTQQEQLVAQQLEEFSLQQHGGGGGSSSGDIGVGYEGSLHDQQQQQPPASLSLFYSGMGIRQNDTGGGGALEWPGVAAADPWLASSQPDPSRRQLEDLESELMCPSPPPPPAPVSGDSSSLIRWLLGDGSGAEQSAWDQAPPPPQLTPAAPLLQHHHPTMVKQELLDDDPFRQQQDWMMQQRQQQSSIPPQLAHLESFTRRTLPIPSPPPLLRPFSMAEAPIHRVPTTNWPPPPPPAPQQQQPQQRDPFMSLMQQQQQQQQRQLMLGSAQQQQQLRELQASLSNKRALFEGSGSSCQQQQQQPVKLARLTSSPASVHAQLGHLQQTIASPGAQWSPGDDVGGARRSQQQQPPLSHRLLLRAAEACECGREELAQSILARLNEHQQQQQQQEQGQSEQQLPMAFLFRDALLERMRPSAATSATTEASPALQLFERVAAFKALCEASPVLRFAYFTANQAIADATQGDDDVHIVDLSEVAASSRESRRRRCSTFGGQWASFVVTAAATSRRRRRRIRVTLVSSAGDASIAFAVESLREFAAASPPSTEFEFRGVAVEPGGSLPGPVELGVRGGEAIAVNLVFPDAAAAPVLLEATRSLSPRVVALVDRDLSPAGGLAARLREGLDYYTAMADSCVPAAGSGAAPLAEVERLVWRPEIDELLFGEAAATATVGGLRPAAMAAAGFRPWRLSDACERQAECLLAPDKPQRQQRAENLVEFSRDDGRLVLLSHRGKVLATASAWTSPP